MFGAVGSIGMMLPDTKQYAPMALGPAPLAAIGCVAVTTAPVVGSPIEAAGIDIPTSCAHVRGETGPVPPLLCPPPQADSNDARAIPSTKGMLGETVNREKEAMVSSITCWVMRPRVRCRY